MSFLDVQDLALLAVQFDFDQIYRAWSGEERSLLGPLEFGLVVVLAGLALRRRRKDY